MQSKLYCSDNPAQTSVFSFIHERNWYFYSARMQ